MSERALPMKHNLLPCPFCGSKEFRYGIEGEHIETGFEVRCDGCSAEIWDVTEEFAINRWNRRVISKTHPLDDHANWSLETFKGEAPADMFLHLEDEILELRKEFIHRTPRVGEELVDIIFMVNSIGLSLGLDLKQIMAEKMEKNKKRVWKNNRHLKCDICKEDILWTQKYEGPEDDGTYNHDECVEGICEPRNDC